MIASAASGMKAQLVEYYSVENVTTSQYRYFTIQLLEQLKLLKSGSFSGVGIVFYYQLEVLPSTYLGNRSATKPELPVCGLEAIARMLANVSDNESLWHDGFHLIDMRSQSLTHISQFLAPPLNDLSQLPENRPNGARQMTALLTSMIPGIAYVGVLSTSEEIVVYENGNILARATDKNE
ncbi:hypothetical protein [Aeromonas hydrophila]|uniref:hypothetical protein n=1 Tax=Aeromonas hydrophila TaxID=644 RepID=UPI0011C0BE7E|nr:hypothetical protein [Aeromonas hydrophila]QEE13618.1 hypothetical protein C1A23_25570 [Aeromonas hydrophila subsp. hydrophila]